MTELVANQMDRDEIDLLASIYRKEITGSFPFIERIYEEYLVAWEKETIDFLFSNRNVYEISESDFENIGENFPAYGFEVPSFEDIYRWLDIMQLVYTTESGTVVHSPLVNVW